MEEDWGALCAQFDISAHEELFSDCYFGEAEWYTTTPTEQSILNPEQSQENQIPFQEAQCSYSYAPEEHEEGQQLQGQQLIDPNTDFSLVVAAATIAESQNLLESFLNTNVNSTECSNRDTMCSIDSDATITELNVPNVLRYFSRPALPPPPQASTVDSVTADSVTAPASTSSKINMPLTNFNMLQASKEEYFNSDNNSTITSTSTTTSSTTSVYSCDENEKQNEQKEAAITEWNSGVQWPPICKNRNPQIGYLSNILATLNLSFDPGSRSYRIAAGPEALRNPTIKDLIHLSEIINQDRGFNNIREHQWLSPAYSAEDIEGKLNPTYYVAVLRPGLTVSEAPSEPITQESETPTLEDIIQGAPGPSKRQKIRTKSKKRRPSLKSWDPVEVFYPLGYISHDRWIHMKDLHADERYYFDSEEFQSQPNYVMITAERQGESGNDISENQYDAFYLRSNPQTGLRECYCGCCKTWHKRDQCNWLHHMKSAHGIRSRTKQRYALPHIMSERPDKKPHAGYFIGFCDKCQSWQNVNNSTSKGNYASWFLHQASHDVERNKLEGCSGKKLSRMDVKRQQNIVRKMESNERKRTLCEIERLVLNEIKACARRVKGQFFNRPENFLLRENRD